MQEPDLANCIDAVVPLNGVSTADYLRILRTDCAPAIRRLQATKAIGWYCFLIHNRATAGRKDLPDAFPEPFIHFRFSPPDRIASSELLGCLREPFLHPIPTTLGRVEGIDETAMLFDTISVSAGIRGCQLVLAPDGLVRITDGRYCGIAHDS